MSFHQLGPTANRPLVLNHPHPSLSPSLLPAAVGECASLMGNDVRHSLCEFGTAAVPLSWQCLRYAGPVNTQRSLAGCHDNRIKYPSGPVTSQWVRTAEWHHLNHTRTLFLTQTHTLKFTQLCTRNCIFSFNYD